MTHSFVVQSRMAALNIDSYNRNAVYADGDLENGNIVVLDGQSNKPIYNEVWEASIPATGSLVGVWMVRSPEAMIVNGSAEQDPREFYVKAKKVFDATYLNPGDVFVITAEGLGGTQGVNTHVIAVDGSAKMTWGTPVASAFCAKLLGSTTIPGTFGNVPAFKFQVLYNPLMTFAPDGVTVSATPAAGAVPKAGAGGKLDAGWLPSDATKQDLLVSGTNIKTINSESLMGAGDIEIPSP
jgi:hypothetical protein